MNVVAFTRHGCFYDEKTQKIRKRDVFGCVNTWSSRTKGAPRGRRNVPREDI